MAEDLRGPGPGAMPRCGKQIRLEDSAGGIWVALEKVVGRGLRTELFRVAGERRIS